VNIRTHLVLLVGAALYACALPPFDLAPLGWVALVPLLTLARRTSPSRAALLGAVAGFYTAWTVTWWLPQAIAAYFDASLLRGVGTISLAFLLASSLAFAAFGWLAAKGESLPAPFRPFMIAASWTLCDLFRARGLDGPWALLGYTQWWVLPIVQVASVTGVHGIGFLVALGNAAVSECCFSPRSAWRAPGVVAALGVPAAVALAGMLVLHVPDESSSFLRVAIVQPDVGPAHTWTRRYSEHQLTSTLRRSASLPPHSVDLVVWPENSVTLYPEHEPYAANLLTRHAEELGADLVFGAPRATGDGVANSARLVRPDGRWFHYDKQRLVPFAETALIGGSDAHAAASPRYFAAGDTPGLLPGRVRMGVSICHELLYPDTIHPAVRAGASLLINIANDGWLDGGYGVASRQHFAMGVLRAVESRRYLVRAAVQGVSGIVAPSGAILVAGDPSSTDILTASVVPRSGETIYVRYGDWFAALCALVVVLVVVAGALPRPRSVRVSVASPV